jgi:ADP-ribosylglycohydrolase
MNPEWLIFIADDLRYEREQLRDEGKDVSELSEEFERLIDALDHPDLRVEQVEDRVDVVGSEVDADAIHEHREEANSLLDAAQALPEREGYDYHEPSDLDGIRETRPGASETFDLPDDQLSDSLYGAWLGRCAGCLLGKPVEGWTTEKMHAILEADDNYPLSWYPTSDVPKSVTEEGNVDPDGVFRSTIDRVEHMPEDDDLNYTIAGLDLLRSEGLGFESSDVARYWMRNIPILRTHTAERVAYRNFANLIDPPESASHRNPYREWIGALIRADPYGYAAVGDPERAAELAWRDARVSHIKNGIYGSMWVAAMLAAAPEAAGIPAVIREGLKQVPAESRLTDAVHDVLDWHEEGISYEDAFERVHKRWDETHYHHWCHTISNAQIIAVGLLWSGRELGPAICRTVEMGFDTDSSGATVGSVIGMYCGAEALSEEWTDPLNDTIESGIDGYQRLPISELAEETVRLSE